MPIKYHNAKDDDGNIINIDNAVRGKDYICLSCGNILRAKIGNGGRSPHFFHINNVECNYETYLHVYAKNYIKHLFDTQEHFFIKFRTKYKCCLYNECEYKKNKFITDCYRSETNTIDLKEYYTTCELETGYNGFIPDILLTNNRINDRKPIFIEINITHPCSDEKKKSGYKMIEITIPKDYETDNLSSLSVLQETSLEKDNKKIHISFYNFKRELPSDEPLDKYSFSVFLINEFDRAEMHPMEASCSKYQYSSLFPSSKYEIHLTESYSEKIYNHCVARACLDGYVQRECIVCHYYWRDERDHFWPHKCGLRKMIHGQTYALRCNNFRYCEMKALELLNEKTE